MGTAGFFGGLLGGIGDELQVQRDRKQKLDLMGRQAELEHWGKLLEKPDAFVGGAGGPAYTDYLNRYFDVLGAMTGNKSARKHLQPAQDFIRAMADKVYAGREEQPSTPGPMLQPDPEAPAAVQNLLQFQLPDVPGIPARKGPWYTPEEQAARALKLKANEEMAMGQAKDLGEMPGFRARQDILSANAIKLEQARADGRTTILRGVPDPRPGANEWDYVDILQYGNGTQELGEGRRPAAIERAYQTAAFIATEEGIPMEQAWARVWAQPYQAGEQRSTLNAARIEDVPQIRRQREAAIANTGQGMTARQLTISDKVADDLADGVLAGVTGIDPKTPMNARLGMAIDNLGVWYKNDPLLSRPEVQAAVKARLLDRQARATPRPKAGLSLKGRVPGRGTAGAPAPAAPTAARNPYR
jgi:hypothetical protein